MTLRHMTAHGYGESCVRDWAEEHDFNLQRVPRTNMTALFVFYDAEFAETGGTLGKYEIYYEYHEGMTWEDLWGQIQLNHRRLDDRLIENFPAPAKLGLPNALLPNTKDR